METKPHAKAAPPRRYMRASGADEIARLLDGADHLEPEVVRGRSYYARRLRVIRIQRRVALFCVIVSALAVLYFGGQLLRVVLS